MPSTDMIAVIAATFFVAGLVKGTLGMGLPTIVLGVLAAPLGLKEAIAFMLFPSLCANIWQGLAGGALAELLRRFWAFYLAAVFGIGIGVSILAGVREEVLLAALGLVLCIYTSLSLAGRSFPPPKPTRERWYSPLAGGLGGVMFGMTGVFIIPGILYLQALRLKRDLLIQAMGVSFLVITVGIAIFMTGHKLLTADHVMTSGLALLPMAAGIAIGMYCRTLISEDAFRRIILVALFISGLHLLARSLP